MGEHKKPPILGNSPCKTCLHRGKADGSGHTAECKSAMSETFKMKRSMDKGPGASINQPAKFKQLNGGEANPQPL